ncbi:hypothetical protein F4826_003413 [Rahnella inusitata]|nr:hypothetical protein [Rahnella inusitata]
MIYTTKLLLCHLVTTQFNDDKQSEFLKDSCFYIDVI